MANHLIQLIGDAGIPPGDGYRMTCDVLFLDGDGHFTK
jgi:hypothetical protein